MQFEEVMQELEALGTEQNRKVLRNHGAHEPIFGTPTGKMKPLAKKIKRDQELAEQLYASGNYDAMYFAGMIADTKSMTEADFGRWIKSAYFYMISDYIVAVTLAETDFAQTVADKWIQSDDELMMSAGWSCYEWLLGSRPDSQFDKTKLKAMLDTVTATIHQSPNRTKYSMNGFVIAVGISFLPLHEEAVQKAKAIGIVSVTLNGNGCQTPIAAEAIRKAATKDRLGFKRKNVRC